MVDVNENVPEISTSFPPLANAFHFVSYLVFAAGLVLLVRTRVPEASLATPIDAVIAPIGVDGYRA